ncbi:MAG TPA: MFS transporter, partial [bacterium]
MPSLLRENKEFRAFWAGQSISLFGDQITLLALPLLAVLLLHAGAQEMGYLTAAGLVPTLLFA